MVVLGLAVSAGAQANPYGFDGDLVLAPPLEAWFGFWFLAFWLLAVLIAIVRAGFLRRKQASRAIEVAWTDAMGIAAARSLDRAIRFLDRSVLLVLLAGLFVSLALVRRTLLMIGITGQVELGTVAGPWSEALIPFLFALCISLVAGLAGTLLYRPSGHTGRPER